MARKFYAVDDKKTGSRWAVTPLGGDKVLAVAKDNLLCIVLYKSQARRRFEILRTAKGKPVRFNPAGVAEIEHRVSRFYGG